LFLDFYFGVDGTPVAFFNASLAAFSIAFFRNSTAAIRSFSHNSFAYARSRSTFYSSHFSFSHFASISSYIFFPRCDAKTGLSTLAGDPKPCAVAEAVSPAPPLSVCAASPFSFAATLLSRKVVIDFQAP